MSRRRVLQARHGSHSEVVQVVRPEPELKPPKHQGLLYNRVLDKFLILLLPVTWFVYCSWRPTFRLRADMPPQFVDVTAAATPSERAREEKLARRYWDLARMMRWEFTYSSPLPADVPLEFRIDEQTMSRSAQRPAPNIHADRDRDKTRPPGVGSPDSRIRYWGKLQSVWLRPDVWEAHQEWSTAWFTGPLLQLYHNFQDYISNLVRIH
jgi:hypothetical protein